MQKPLPQLKEINLYNSTVTEKTINELFHHAPNLEVLNIEECSLIDWKKVNQKFPKNLHEIRLGITNTEEDQHFDDKHLNELLSLCTKLEKISIVDSGLDNCTSGLIVSSPLVMLKELNLCASVVHGKGLNELLKLFPNLEELDISNIESVGIAELDTAYLSSLKRLGVRNDIINEDELRPTDLCIASIDDIEKLIQSLPKLEKLLIFRTQIVGSSDDAVAELQKKYPSLSVE